MPKAALDCINCVRWTPNDTHLVGGARNGTLRIWSMKTKQVSRYLLDVT
jgi:WD40 repeat protein